MLLHSKSSRLPLITLSPPTKYSPAWRRRLPQWIATLVIVLIVTKKFILPRIAQYIIQRSKMRILKATILSPTSDQLTMQLTTLLYDILPLPFAGALKFVHSVNICRFIQETTRTCIGTSTIEKEVAIPSTTTGVIDINAKVQITPETQERFAQFSQELVLSDRGVEFVLEGQVEVLLAHGMIKIGPLQFVKQVSLLGMEGLQRMSIGSVSVLGGTVSYILLSVSCTIVNTSNVSLVNIGDCYFAMYYRGVGMVTSNGGSSRSSNLADIEDTNADSDTHENRYETPNRAGSQDSTLGLNLYVNSDDRMSDIGDETNDTEDGIEFNTSLATIHMPNVTLRTGANQVTAYCYFTVPDATYFPNEYLWAKQVLSNFVQGVETNGVIITGHPTQSTSIPYLQPSLSSLYIVTSLPGLQSSHPMIKKATMVVNLSPMKAAQSLFSLSAPSRLELYNPLDTEITILGISSTVQYQGSTLGVLKVDFTNTPSISNTTSKHIPITIPPKSVVVTMELDMVLKMGYALLALIDVASGNLEVDVSAELNVKIGEYSIPHGLHYNQDHVPVSLSFS